MRTSAGARAARVGSPPVRRTRDAQPDEHPDQRGDLLVRKQVGPRLVVDAALGHAVGAGVVAAIGDRDPQVLDDARLGIDEPAPRPSAASARMDLPPRGCRAGAARPRGPARARSACGPPARRPPGSPAAGTPARRRRPASARESIAAGPMAWNESSGTARRSRAGGGRTAAPPLRACDRAARGRCRR